MKTIGIGSSHRRIVAFAATFVFLGTLTLAGSAVASPITDTTTANFSAGTTTAGTYVSETVDGEVILAPTEGSEFFGSALPPGWFKEPWSPPSGDASVSGGKLTVDGARAGTTATYGSGRTLEFSATFPVGTQNAHIGFGVDYNDPPWAMFSLKGDGSLWARTQETSSPPGPPGVETSLPGYLGSPHRFRIEWNAGNVVYYVDGAPAATHNVSFGATEMRPLASDYNLGGGSLLIDWVRMSPYTSPGTFTSRVLDAGGPVVWGSLDWTADQPAGTSVALSVRTGNTPVPDVTWSAFSPIASPGADVPGFSRYAQYRAVLTTPDPGITPTLSDVSINYTIDSTPPTITITKPSAQERFTLDQNVTAVVSCSDPGSGISTCSYPVKVNTSQLGNFKYTVTAQDLAGNNSSVTHSYAVDPPRYANVIKGDGPIAYYRMGEPLGSDPMLDSSGNNHNGEYKNGIALRRPPAIACHVGPHAPYTCDRNADRQDFAAWFPARDGYGFTNGITAPKTAYTLEAWIKRAGHGDGSVVGHGGGGQLFIKNDRLALRQTQDTVQSSDPALTPGQWFHVAATWNGSTTRLYVNGQQVASSSSANKPPSGISTFYVGYGDQAPWFHGSLDEAAYYGKALSESAIRKRWVVGTAKDVPSPVGGPPIQRPSAHIDTPANGGLYAPTKVPALDFYCEDLDGPATVASCTATVDGVPRPNGFPLPDSLGPHTVVVTALDTDGLTRSHKHKYTVKTFSGIFKFDSPIAYYRLGDGSDGPMVDSSGNGRNGEYKNDQDSGPTGISGDGDKARDFFGAGGYGFVNGINAPRFQSTLEAWVRPLGNLDPSSSEFDGSSLPGGWSVRNIWQPGGSATVSGGELILDGASAGTDATYGSGRTLDFKATFAPGTPFAHVGFGTEFIAPPWAIFSVKGDGILYARTDNNSGGVIETNLGIGYLGSPHRFRIEWNAGKVVYYVDGDVVASHNVSFGATKMRPLASEYNSGGGKLRVDWLRMSPHDHRGDASIVGHGDAGEIYIRDRYFHFRHMDKTVTSSVSVKLGEWQQVVGTWDGVDIRIYVDGVEAGKTEATKRPSSISTFYVGYGELAPWFRGAIDEVAYYGTALPPARVYEHFLADPPPSDQGDSGAPGDSSINGGTGGGSTVTEDPPVSDDPSTGNDPEPGPEGTPEGTSPQCEQATEKLKKAKAAHSKAKKKLIKARGNAKRGLRKKVTRTGKKVAEQRSLTRRIC